MIVVYSCRRCGVSERGVEVRARNPGEDEMEWIGATVLPALTHDHHVKSPRCRPTALSRVRLNAGRRVETHRVDVT